MQASDVKSCDIKDARFRKASGMFEFKNAKGNVCFGHKFYIEANTDGRWLPFGDETGILKYDTEKERDDYLKSCGFDTGTAKKFCIQNQDFSEVENWQEIHA